MTAARRRRTDPTQPELPLRRRPADPEVAGDPAGPAGSTGGHGPPGPGADDHGGGSGWRLDERTRQVGLRGVAFARAQLVRSETAGEARGQRRGRGPSGRAA